MIEAVEDTRLIIRNSVVRGSKGIAPLRFSGAQLNITNSLIEATPGDKFGAIYAARRPGANATTPVMVYIAGSIITGNNATYNGGGLYLGPGSNGTVESTAMVGNRAVNGGAIAVEDGGCLWDVINSDLSNNVATQDGGAYYERDANPLCSRLRMTGTLVANNTASRTGGGLFISGSKGKSLTLSLTNLTGNRASGDGGGIFISNPRSGLPPGSPLPGVLDVTEGQFAGNAANGSGGGVLLGPGASFTINRSLFTNNAAGGAGGGILCLNCSGGSINATGFTNNSAAYGGGFASFGQTGRTVLGGVEFDGDTAQSLGGLRNSSVTRGSQSPGTIDGLPLGAGGGMFIDAAKADTVVDRGIFRDNSAGDGGEWEGVLVLVPVAP